MSPLVIALLGPLLAAAAIVVARRWAAALALAGAVTALFAALRLVALMSGDGGTLELILPGLPDLPLRLAVTPLTSVLALMVATVGAFVLVYAVGYMRGDRGRVRFFALMSLFLAAMLALVLAGDWILLLAAWELIGLCSYLLIGFWFERTAAATAATRAFLYTRSADLGLYVAVFLLIAASGSSEIAASLEMGAGAATLAGGLLLVAAMGKSAQVPLQDWLLRAMAGPTPVSALLHSATLVAAGAILLIRSAPLLTPGALVAVGLVGGVTTVVAGLMALAERDLKRMLAASTASQYGLMLIAVGAGAPFAALLHLLAHAVIKSALFLGAGMFQHARGGTDFDELSGAGRGQPRVFAGFALAALALAGIPPLSGFFSKDAVIAAALGAGGWLAVGAVAGTLLTGAYMGRALRLLWRGRGDEHGIEGAGWMGAGLLGLVTLAAALGAAFGPLEEMLDAHAASGPTAVALGLTAAVAGLLLGWLVPARRLLGPLHPAARGGFVIRGGLAQWVNGSTLAMARASEGLERGLYAGALAIGRVVMAIGRGVRAGDERGLAGVFAAGRAVMAIGQGVRVGDERGIDGVIASIVQSVRGLGERARALQSGLVHRELAFALTGVVLVLVILAGAAIRI